MNQVYKIDTILYDWLKEEWRKNNHTKYQKYFEEWASKLTDGQINGFSKARTSDYIQH